jgi:hypothetical protein
VHVLAADEVLKMQGLPYFLHEWGRHAAGIILLTASEGKLGAIASHMDRVSNS